MGLRSPSQLGQDKTLYCTPQGTASTDASDSRGVIVGVLHHDGASVAAPEDKTRLSPQLNADARCFLRKIIDLGLLSANVVDAFLSEREERLAEYTSGMQIG